MKTFLLLAAISTALVSQAAVTEVNCTFTGGIPADFTLTDADGNTLAAGLDKFGFSQGDAWVALHLDEEDNDVACSTSWYKPVGTSSDWMTLPQISVQPGAELSWRACASDSRFRDGYAIYVSASGPLPDDFDTSAPLFSIDMEEAAWQSRSVSLAPWEGKSVWITFVNNSTNKSRLLVDDIYAGIPSDIHLESTLPPFVVKGREFCVSGFLSNLSDHNMVGPTANLTLDGNEYSATLTDFSLAPGERKEFRWTPGVSFDVADCHNYTFTVAVDNAKATTSGTLRSVGYRVVVEEATGTWCGNCVRGIAGIKACKEDFGENFLAVAMHNSDPMAIDTQLSDIMSIPGYPASCVNRGGFTDPSPDKLRAEVRKYIDLTPEVGIVINLNYSQQIAELNADFYFPGFYSDQDYRVVAYVIENDVHGSARGYAQQNAYADGSMGAMDGFEQMESPIDSELMYYQEVLRVALTDPMGDFGSLPSSIKAGEKCSWSKSFSLPTNVNSPDKCEVVVLVVDGKSGRVLNGELIPISDSSSVESVADRQDAEILAIYGADGICRQSLSRGLNIVRYSDGTVRKIMCQ